MIEYTRPERPRRHLYCWICRRYGCDLPRQVSGDLSIWSSRRAVPPTLTGEDPWSWLNGSPARWWYVRSDGEAA